ncbi:DUF6263 family protein [uncultured Tenacibaculum sp.]|uniref:DUF6263 family protein n=1 Tax=uncultured Tenacibaculum sp. TaxID=174713 RepID=UPI002625230B|nr:DUF6263 family protein [uncultured Tenacibaculum sp.]
MKQNMIGMMDLDINMDMSMKVTGFENDYYSTEMKFTHATIDMMAQGKTIKYDSNVKEEDMNPFAKGAHVKMKPLLESVMGFTYDKLGEVKETKVISGTASADAFKENSNGIMYPKEAVEVGTAWKESKTTGEGVKMNYEYKITAIDNDKVTIGISGTISEVGAGTLTGTAYIERKTGNVSNLTIDMNMDIMGQKMKQVLTMTTTKI